MPNEHQSGGRQKAGALLIFPSPRSSLRYLGPTTVRAVAALGVVSAKQNPGRVFSRPGWLRT